MLRKGKNKMNFKKLLIVAIAVILAVSAMFACKKKTRHFKCR